MVYITLVLSAPPPPPLESELSTCCCRLLESALHGVQQPGVLRCHGVVRLVLVQSVSDLYYEVYLIRRSMHIYDYLIWRSTIIWHDARCIFTIIYDALCLLLSMLALLLLASLVPVLPLVACCFVAKFSVVWFAAYYEYLWNNIYITDPLTLYTDRSGEGTP